MSLQRFIRFFRPVARSASSVVVTVAAVAAAKKFAAVLLIVLPMLTGCVPVLLATATVTAVDVSLDRRSPGRYLDDNLLEVRLRSQLRQDQALGSAVNISVTSFNGIVLLTGEVNTDEQRMRAGTIVQGDGSTRKLVNELQLAGKTNVVGRANDALLTGKVKTQLLSVDEQNLSSKIKVVTEHGKVYLLGLVTPAEADAAVEAAQEVRGVTHIVKVFEYIE